MQSFTDLNAFNNTIQLEFDDIRNANVIFNVNNPANQTQIVDEGSSFNAAVGIEILDIYRFDLSLPTYTIDVRGLNNTTVTWNNQNQWPSYLTLDDSVEGLYVVSGLRDVSDWQLIRSPLINLPSNVPNAFFGTWTYISTIDYFSQSDGTQQKKWFSTVTVLDVVFLSTPLQFVYETNQANTILNTPQIGDFDAEYPGAEWTIQGTVSNGNAIVSWASDYTEGGTFTYNNANKSFTITGSRLDVNGHLSNLVLTTNLNTEDFFLFYQLSNDRDTSTDTQTQAFKNADVQFLGNVEDDIVFYTEDTASPISGGPKITDTDFDGTGTYSLAVYPNNLNAVILLSATGTGGSTAFDNSLKKLTITGTRDQVNSYVDNIILTPGTDFIDQFFLTYELTLPSPRSGTSAKIQTLICNSEDNEVTNMNLSRNYLSNNENIIFAANNPFISDFDTTPGRIYTVVFNTQFGKWTTDGVTLVNPLTFTGTRSQVDAFFPTVKFYPNFGVTQNVNFSYQQFKDNVFQVEQTVALINVGSGTYTDSREIDFTASATFTPSLKDVMYGKISEILVVGGGGGGSNLGGGGGGGQVIYSANPILLQSETYTISVGNGGTNGATNGSPGQNSVAFGITALGGNGGQGLTGGSSRNAGGTVIPGGTGGNWSNTAGTKTGVMGGGGAGSGGALPYQLRYTDGSQPDNINAFLTNPTISSRAPAAGGAGIGATVGSRFQLNSQYSGEGTRTGSSYGSGGAGANYSLNDNALGQAGFSFRVFDLTFGRGANFQNSTFNNFTASVTDYLISGVRQPSIAGTGGGGGANGQSGFPGATGGKGVVRIYISAR